MSKNELPELFFKNPQKLPLDKLYLKIKNADGEEKEVKALDKFWVSERFYPCFPPIPENDAEEERKKWLQRADNFIKPLIYVLNLPFYKFWSHILYEPAIAQMLDSFFQKAVPCYLPQPTGEFEAPYAKIYDLVFRIYNRILTPKKSETEFFIPETLGRLLKDEQVVNNYVLWDISKFYGHLDDGTVEKLIKDAYEFVPELKEELILVVTCMTEIFEAIGTAAYEEEAPTEKLVNKLVLLLYDTAFAINMFMKMYPQFKDVCLQEDLISRLIHTYESEVHLLYILMKSVFINDDHPGYDRTDNARIEILETCHSLTSHCMDLILQNSDNKDEQNKWVETYMKLLEMIIGQNNFLTDYDRVFPISQDVEMLQAVCPDIDKEKCKSIMYIVKQHETEQSEVEARAIENTSENTENVNEEGTLDEATVPEHIILESKVTELMDVFPDLGDGFLEQCLIYMNMDSQAVIMAILEDTLPPELANLDRSFPRIPPEQPEAGPSLEAAYIGKKPSEHNNFTELLNDKTHVRELKERLLINYSVTAEEDALYDDDYDDRYEDDFAVGVDTVDIEEIRRPRRRGQISESEEEEEEQPSEERKPNRDAFCEDPAVIRARREARYQQNRRGPPPQQQAKAKDVVGKPKGQGQDKQVLQNREKKNVNKSSRANHNRRQGAQWKRNRGMIPS